MRLTGVILSVLVTSAVFAGLGTGTLTVAGNAVPSNFITENGRVYVPLSDVAKALNMSISKSGSGYALAPAGGAGQVQGLTGKVGQILNCGYATLQVVKVTQTDKYMFQFGNGFDIPASDKERLYAIQLRVKNATSKTVLIGYRGTENSALVDNDSHSYQSYSAPGDPDVSSGNELLPGSAKDFTLCYSVPKAENAVQLVYGVFFYQVPTRDLKQFRIDLAP